jgi:hypothetical protein
MHAARTSVASATELQGRRISQDSINASCKAQARIKQMLMVATTHGNINTPSIGFHAVLSIVGNGSAASRSGAGCPE